MLLTVSAKIACSMMRIRPAWGDNFAFWSYGNCKYAKRTASSQHNHGSNGNEVG